MTSRWNDIFAPQSLLSVAGFYKNIGTYIRTLTSIQPFFASGLSDSELAGTGVGPSDSFTFSQPVNTPGKLKGFEVNDQQPLRFLPGFLHNPGLLLDHTYVGSNINYIVTATTRQYTNATLIGLSRNAYNATLYYLLTRVSWRIAAITCARCRAPTIPTCSALSARPTSMPRSRTC